MATIDQLKIILLVIVAGLATISDVGAQDRWPQFRGAQARGISAEAISADGSASDSKLPDQWSTTTNIAWKKDIPGRGWSSPVVWDSKVFLAQAGLE